MDKLYKKKFYNFAQEKLMKMEVCVENLYFVQTVIIFIQNQDKSFSKEILESEMIYTT